MQQRQTIDNLRANDEVHSVFLIGAASLQQSRNGPYWRLELRDATGSVEAKIWSPLSTSFTDLAAGQLVEVTARAGLFRDQLQLTVDALRSLSPGEVAAVNLADFIPASPRSPADMLAEIEELCHAELTHRPWLVFALSVLRDESIRTRLLTAPAAKSVHHAYAGGLLEHMLSVAGLCLRMADHYPELDRQTLFTAALFHDIGKLEEMSGGLVNDYTDAGLLLGHIVQGLLMVEPHLAASGLEPELALHFRHLIASHHGELEFGSPRQPATAEAFALHYADNADAKIAQCRALLPNPTPMPAPTGDTAESAGLGKSEISSGMPWTPRQTLLGRSLCRPAHTPDTVSDPATQEKRSKRRKVSTPTAGDGEHREEAPASAKNKEDRQCSLL